MRTEHARSVSSITLSIAAMVAISCGPSCPEVKAALDDHETISEDVARVNAMVAKRKAAIAEATGGTKDSFRLERLKFSVTAYEKAIESQIRIIKLSPKFMSSPLYLEHAQLIMEIRCLFDGVAQAEEHTISDGVGKRIGLLTARFDLLTEKACTLTSAERRDYLENGIGSK